MASIDVLNKRAGIVEISYKNGLTGLVASGEACNRPRVRRKPGEA